MLGRDLARRALPLLERVGLDLDPRTRAGRLSLGRQQLVELAKALASDPRLLILDEATSALDDDQVRAVFRVVRELREQGGSVIVVSHRMAELFAIADRLTVLKDGAVMATRDRDETDHDDIVRLMIGREPSDLFPAKATAQPADPLLTVRGLAVTGAYASGIATRRVKIAAYALAGLFVGLAGIGLSVQTGSGDATIGAPYTVNSIAASVLAGVSFFGGVGQMRATVLAALAIGLLTNLLLFTGLSPFYQLILQGAVLIVAITIKTLATRRGEGS